MGEKLERIFKGVDESRIVTAIPTAPIVPIVVAYCVFSLFSSWYDFFQGFFPVLLLFGFPGLLVETFIGLPVFLLYQYLGWRSLYSYLAGGLSIGLLVFCLFHVSGLQEWFGGSERLAFICPVYGGLAASVFWAIVWGPWFRPKHP